MIAIKNSNGDTLHEVEANTLKGANLSKLNLYGARFVDLDLRGSLFIDANMQNSVFIDCDLTGAVFSGADLYDAQFIGCKLGKARFRHSNCRFVQFYECNLETVDFMGANLSDAGSRLYSFIGLYGIGSKRRQTLFIPELDKIWCGCFIGTLDQFTSQVKHTYGGNIDTIDYYNQYQAAISYLRHFAKDKQNEKN